MIKKLLFLMVSLAMCAGNAAALTMDLGEPNNNTGDGWYDETNNQISFLEAWSYRPGWWFGTLDLSDYDQIIIKLEDATATVQVMLEYNDGDAVSANGTNEITIDLDADLKSSVKQMYFQCGTAGATATFVSAEAVTAIEYNEIPLELTEGHTILATEFDQYDDATKVKMHFLNNTDPYASRQGWGIGQFSNSDNWSANEYSFALVGLAGTEFDIMCTVGDMKKAAKNGTDDYVPGEWHEGGITFNVYNDCSLDGVYVLIEAEAEAQYIYVVGDFQNWDINNPLIVEGVDNVYGFEAEGISAFKFSTVYDGDNWELFNSGAYTLNTNAVIGENALVPGDWNIALPWAGDYTIVIDLNNMIIELATDTPEPVVDTTIYLRGYMNDWGADEAYAFTEGEDGLYTLTLSMVEEGVEFKFATEDWETVDMGGVLDMLPGIVYTLTWHEASNCSLARTLYDVTFTLDVDASTVIVDGTTGIESIAADAENAVYYNLQGVRVANPERGTFVKVVNGKATKVAF